MTPRQARANRRVIETARAIERANQYGINPKGAVHDYEQARAEQRRAVSLG